MKSKLLLLNALFIIYLTSAHARAFKSADAKDIALLINVVHVHGHTEQNLTPVNT